MWNDKIKGLAPRTAIEEIEAGDKAWSRDVETGETALKAVTDLIRRHERAIWEVVLTNAGGEAERFETTDDHPWRITGRGWITTQRLALGMAVVAKDGRGMVVASVAEANRTHATCNLTVADFETYFVGEQSVLVYNCPTGADANRAASRAKGIPDRQIGPSGKPKVHTAQHSATKEVRINRAGA